MHSDVLVIRNTHVDEKLFYLLAMVSLDDDLFALIRIILFFIAITLAILILTTLFALLRKASVGLEILH